MTLPSCNRTRRNRTRAMNIVAASSTDGSGVRGMRPTLLLLAVLAGVMLGVRPTPALHLASLSADLLAWQASPSSERVRIIVPGARAELDALLARHPVAVVRWLSGGVVLNVTPAELQELASDTAVHYLSGDMVVSPAMAVSDQSTGADQTWRGTAGSLLFGGIAGVTGAGVGVAVIDSGISPHAALVGKVVAAISLVPGDAETTDLFGHGTHVAGIIAGAPVAATGNTPPFAGGIAPGAHLVNIRVLAANGLGYTSDVIAGIDWAIAHRLQYQIRIINLSVGHPVMEPALTDPLCQAVARATAQGLVVVASAGNAGRDPSGHRVLGGIGSPGNSPFALTVGALSNGSTVARADDTVAEYSSRGPTRFDFAVKPDLVAPGTRIESLEAAGSVLTGDAPLHPHRWIWEERLHAPQWYEHGGADGQRGGGAPAAGFVRTQQ